MQIDNLEMKMKARFKGIFLIQKDKKSADIQGEEFLEFSIYPKYSEKWINIPTMHLFY